MLYVITHKKLDGYQYCHGSSSLLQVGVGRNGSFGYLGDDFDGGISCKNDLYSELTGVYYLLKQCCDQVVGVCHYRRVFYDSAFPGWFDKKVKSSRLVGLGFDYKSIEGRLLSGEIDFFLPKKRMIITKAGLKTIYSHFCYHKDGKYFDDFISEVKRRDAAMGVAYERFVKRSCFGSYWNMFIARRDVFQLVFSEVFDVLFDFERQLLKKYGAIDKRLMGYFTESFIPFLVEYKRLRTGYINVAYVIDL